MGSLALAYVAAWVAVVIYISWLRLHSRRLERRLKALEVAKKEGNSDQELVSRAA